MNKQDEIDLIIEQIREQAKELSDDMNTESMSAIEIVVLATELSMNMPVTSIQYTQPIGIVDTSKVSFMLDEEFEFPLYEEAYEEQD